MRVLSRLLFLFLTACIFFKAHGQGSSTVSGQVTDAQTRQPLPGALLAIPGRTDLGAVTDISGKYQMQLPVGTFQVICSFLGMHADTILIKSEGGMSYTRDIKLRPSATNMGTVVVSASRYEQNISEAPVSMQILPATLIESKNTTNIKTALEQTPGLVILDEEPQMRGGSGFTFGVGSRVATLIDGLPIMTGDAGRTEWDFIPIESIEQVEIVEGASSVLYGSSALSGTINFLTKYPRDSGMTYIRAYTGFYSTPQNDSAKWWDGAANFSGLNFSTASKYENLDMVFGGQVSYDHNFIGPYILDGSTPIKADTLDNSDVADRSGRFNFNLRYRPPKNPRMSYGMNGNVMFAHTNFSLVWGNSNEGIYRAYPGTMTITDFAAFYVDPFLNFFTRRGGKHHLRTRWYYSDNNNNNGQSNQTDVLIADYSFSRIFHKLNGLNATGGFYFSQSFSHANLYAGGGSPDNQLKNRAAFIQLNHNFLKVLQVSAGVRGEYFQINDEESAFRPVFRSGVNLKLTKTTFLRASYGQGFRYPTIAEKFVVTSTGGINVYPNPDIKAESSSSMEAGVKQSFRWGQFSGFADLAFFQQEYENMIEYVYAIWVPDYPGFKFVNTGNTRVQGAEFSVAGGGKVGRDMELRFLAGYTYVKPQTLEPNYVFATDNPPDGILPTELTYVNTSTDTTDNILKYRFRHLVKADVEFSFKRFTVGASARYYSYMQNIDKLFYDLDQPGLLETGIREYREENDEGSLVFDARASVKVGRYYQVALISNNIANLEYTLRPLKIESPRTIALQVTAKF